MSHLTPPIIQSVAIVSSNDQTHAYFTMISIHYVSIILGLRITIGKFKEKLLPFYFYSPTSLELSSAGPSLLPPKQELEITFVEQGIHLKRMADDKWVIPQYLKPKVAKRQEYNSLTGTKIELGDAS